MDQMSRFWLAHRRMSDANVTFLELSKTMTRGELAKLIAKRPSVWGRFSAWLNTLPETR